MSEEGTSSEGEQSESRAAIRKRHAELGRDIRAVRDGTHHALKAKYTMLDTIMDDRLQAAERWHQLRVKNLQVLHDAEVQAIRNQNQADHGAVHEAMLGLFTDHHKRLAVEVRSSQAQRARRRRPKPAPAPENQPTQNTKRKAPPSKKACTISLSLRADEIHHDLHLMKATPAKRPRPPPATPVEEGEEQETPKPPHRQTTSN